MLQKNKVPSQKELFVVELTELRRNVSAKDRLEAIQQFQLTRNTISQYLNGLVRDCDTAAALILFFKKRIYQRNLVLLDTVLDNSIQQTLASMNEAGNLKLMEVQHG